jgi:glycosyltransferase involved in cell wall biosynthesis
VRVVHVTPYFAPAFVYGGPPRSVLGLCQGLQASGVDVEVVTTAANGDEDLPASSADGDIFDGVPVHYARRAFPRRLFGAAVRDLLGRLLAHADVCHVHGLWNVPGWEAGRAARRAGTPVVISPRGMLQPAAFARGYWRKRAAFAMVERRNLTAAARLHATTDEEASALHAYTTDPSRVVVIPNGVTTPTEAIRTGVRGRLGIPSGVPLVLYLGRLHPIKRLDLLARAMAEVRARHPAAHLVLAGPDERNHLASLAPHLAPLGRSVHCVGAIDDADKWALLHEAAAVALCSDSENFGMSVAEAMAASRPVVVTRTCPWPDVAAFGCGYWVDQSAAAIAGALSSVLDDAAAAAAMGQRGARMIESRYGWASVARAMAACYAEAIAESRARAR